ncbi:hypothetical protein OQJ26_08980 [Legionella sp. PATHC038]|uniref:hypothetical protein n=1 Tax=Legionella sheltonii TaxID=2992041 RepID=UPI0022436FAF|nr:hypothetical protein [Legionella sp. PATHC038]MCW8398921.1 hypothetical protein [Legionella sp. PATHC038]
MIESEIANTIHEAAVILKEIQRSIDYDAELSISKFDSDKVSKKVVLISQIIKATGDSSKAMMQIGSSARTFQNIPPTESLTSGLSAGSIIVAVLDFLLIPFIYLSCYLLNTKIPVTRENNAKWFISGVLFALAITSIAVPAIAVGIAFTTVSISLALSLFLLAKTLHEYYQVSKEIRAIRKLLASAEIEMEEIQRKAVGLTIALKEVGTKSELISLCTEIGVLQEAFAAQKKHLLELKLKEFDLNNKLENANLMQVMTKSVAFSLSALGLIGLIVSLFSPLAGLGILTAVSAISLAFVVVRLAIPLSQFISGWIPSTFNSNAAKSEHADTYDLDHELSTDVMLERFWGSKENAHDILKIAPPRDIDYSLTSTAPLFQTRKNAADPSIISGYQPNMNGLS